MKYQGRNEDFVYCSSKEIDVKVYEEEVPWKFISDTSCLWSYDSANILMCLGGGIPCTELNGGHRATTVLWLHFINFHPVVDIHATLQKLILSVPDTFNSIWTCT